MRTSVLFGAVLVFAFAMATVAETPEKDPVRVTLENYIKGHMIGDGEFMRKALHYAEPKQKQAVAPKTQ